MMIGTIRIQINESQPHPRMHSPAIGQMELMRMVAPIAATLMPTAPWLAALEISASTTLAERLLVHGEPCRHNEDPLVEISRTMHERMQRGHAVPTAWGSGITGQAGGCDARSMVGDDPICAEDREMSKGTTLENHLHGVE